MNVLSLILIILSVSYIFLGNKALRLDKRSLLNRLFFALNLSLIIWSVASAFHISAYNEATSIFWYKLSSVGFYLLIGIVLHFFLVYTIKKALLKQWWIYILLYVPGLIFSYMEVTFDFYAKAYIHGSNGWIITARTDSMWFWAFFHHYLSYTLFV